MRIGSVDTSKLITQKYDFGEAPRAYDRLVSNDGSLGFLLEYPTRKTDIDVQRSIMVPQSAAIEGRLRIGFIGAGNYASRVLIPAFASKNVFLESISSNMGLSAVQQQINMDLALQPDTDQISSDCDAIVISTRHDTHAEFVLRGLVAGKHVFVESRLSNHG